jgi:serine/threonine protein kinase
MTLDDFIIGKSLGQGRFGTAHIAFHKHTGAIFAIKKVKKEVIKANKLIDQFILEVKLQSFLVHPFILKIYGIFHD